MLNIIKKVIQRTSNLLGYKISSISKNDPLIKFEFDHIYNICHKYTMTSIERMCVLSEAVKYVINSDIPGDFVECGVWRGGSVMIIALTLLEMNVVDRKIYLYDTFEGMSRPTKEDFFLSRTDVFAINKWEKKQKKDQEKKYNEWCFASLAEVEKNMSLTGYPRDKIIFVKGKVEDTIPKIIPKQIALLRLDTDFYESTRHELSNLFPILSKKGVLIIDDYGHLAGSKKAVDEYFLNKSIFLNRIDCTGRLGIKTE